MFKRTKKPETDDPREALARLMAKHAPALERMRAPLRGFEAAVNESRKPLPGGRVAVDAARLGPIVAANRELAAEFVSAACAVAGVGPRARENLQNALFVAAAYQAEFGDATLVDKVYEHAAAIGAEEHLQRISLR